MDLIGAAQRQDGMIWSFAFPIQGPAHHLSLLGLQATRAMRCPREACCSRGSRWRTTTRQISSTRFTSPGRPGATTLGWPAHLDQAKKALEYSVTDKASWSEQLPPAEARLYHRFLGLPAERFAIWSRSAWATAAADRPGADQVRHLLRRQHGLRSRVRPAGGDARARAADAAAEPSLSQAGRRDPEADSTSGLERPLLHASHRGR